MREPFNAEKYFSNPQGWQVYTREGNIVEAIYASSGHEMRDYPLLVVLKENYNGDVFYHSYTCTQEGIYDVDASSSFRDLVEMEPKTVVVKHQKVVFNTEKSFRTIYYNKSAKKLVEKGNYFYYNSALEEVAKQTDTNLLYLCTISLEDHPQVRETMIAAGLAANVILN